MSQNRNYVFTYNNHTFKRMRKMIMDTRYTYMTFGFEVGEEGTPHLQGYIEFESPKRITEIRDYPFDKCRFAIRKGTQAEAINYCHKEGDYYEFGEKKNQGARNDLLAIKAMIDEGCTLDDVANEHFGDFTRYNFQKYIDVKKVYDHGHCDVMIYRGDDPMSWKDVYPSTIYISGDEYLSCYDGEECIVFHNGGHYGDIERFAHDIPVPVKYGFQNRKILPKYVIYCEPKFSTKNKLYDYVTEVCGGNNEPHIYKEIIEEEIILSE